MNPISFSLYTNKIIRKSNHKIHQKSVCCLVNFYSFVVQLETNTVHFLC